jgi:hypothetical protein
LAYLRHLALLTLSINDFRHNSILHYAECSGYLNVKLGVTMVNVIMLSVIMLNVVMLNVIMLNVILLNVIILNVAMLSVIAPHTGQIMQGHVKLDSSLSLFSFVNDAKKAL